MSFAALAEAGFGTTEASVLSGARSHAHSALARGSGQVLHTRSAESAELRALAIWNRSAAGVFELRRFVEVLRRLSADGQRRRLHERFRIQLRRVQGRVADFEAVDLRHGHRRRRNRGIEPGRAIDRHDHHARDRKRDHRQAEQQEGVGEGAADVPAAIVEEPPLDALGSAVCHSTKRRRKERNERLEGEIGGGSGDAVGTPVARDAQGPAG